MSLCLRHDEQIQQRQANLEELASSASRSIRARSSGTHTISELVDAHGAAHRTTSSRPSASRPITSGRILAIRVVRQGELPGAVRRPREDPGLRPAGRAARARLPDLQAARFRRLGRRRRAAVPHQDQRADDLGVAAALPREVPAAAAREVARPDRRRDPLPPALSRSDRQPRLAAGVRDAQPGRVRRSASS